MVKSILARKGDNYADVLGVHQLNLGRRNNKINSLYGNTEEDLWSDCKLAINAACQW